MTKISKLYVELSSACNLNCTMCFRNSWFDEKCGLMSDEAVDRIKDAIENDETDSVFFGGMGEPLMHKRLFELIKFASIRGKRTELITNATLLNADVCKKLVESGIDTLWISMDGFTKKSYEEVRLGSVYTDIVKNIGYFNELRNTQKLGITFVMMKENIKELEYINAFADKHHFDFINLSHVVPCDELKKEDSIYEFDCRIGKMHRFDKDEIYSKKVDLCPFVNDNACFVRYDGEVGPCMQILHNSYTYLYEEKRKVYSYSFGNICDKPLIDIYNSNKYADFRERVRNFEFPCCTICLGCEDRKENVTDCMYNENPTCGACLWAQGYIRCP